MYKFLVGFCILTFLLLGCNSKNFQQSQPIKIKGLYLGMDIKSVPEILKKISINSELVDMKVDDIVFSDGRCVLLVDKDQDEKKCEMIRGQNGAIIVSSGIDGKVNSVSFKRINVFKSRQLKIDEFLKYMEEALSIPKFELTFVSLSTTRYHTSTSTAGDKITVTEDDNKSTGVYMEKVKNLIDSSKGFN